MLDDMTKMVNWTSTRVSELSKKGQTVRRTFCPENQPKIVWCV